MEELINKMAEAIEKATDCIIDEYYCFNNEKTIAKAALAAIQEDYVLVRKEAVEGIIGKVKDMSVAHAMSHEPFCDTYAWRDDFNREKEKVLDLLKDIVG